MVALVLADALLEKTGGDSVVETARNLRSYLDAVPDLLRSTGSSSTGSSSTGSSSTGSSSTDFPQVPAR
jgi:chorismate synthase